MIGPIRTATLAFHAGVCACLIAGCAQAPPPPPKAAVPVVVADVQQRDVPLQVKAIGNVEPYSTVALKPQVSAQVMSVHFKEGQDVHKGDLLFTLDRRQIEADLNKLQSTVNKDVSELNNAKVEAQRYAKLMQEGVIARERYDQVRTQAESLESTVAADKAAVENIRVQLLYTAIRSPIDGRTGSLQVNPGNIVKANDVPVLVTINQVSPIYVNFAIPEQQLAELKRYHGNGNGLKVLAMINGDERPAEGKLTFIDNAVDAATGTIKLKATFPNTDRRLWPGQFISVVLTLTNQPNQIVIPNQAIVTGQQGQFVYVVKADKTAESRPIVVSRNDSVESVVQSGLKAGEVVVTDGQVRLVPGAKVEIKSTQKTAAPVGTGL